jgi:hypothetical protein
MAFDIKEADTTFDLSNTIKVSSRLDPTKEHFHFSGSPLSSVGSDLTKNTYLTTFATIKVGPQAEKDWSFGFIQAAHVKNVFVSYSGKSFLLGSVGITMNPDGDFDCPDYFSDQEIAIDPSLRAQIPWTKKASERFKFDAAKGVVTCNTSDGPGGHVPVKVSNKVTHVDNFLRVIIDHRRFCCALVLEEPKATPSRRVISHQIWDLKFVFDIKWRNGVPQPTSSSSRLSVSNFVFGPPTDPSFTRIVDPNFLKGQPCNQILFERLSSALKGNAPRFRSDTDTTSANADFFQ